MGKTTSPRAWLLALPLAALALAPEAARSQTWRIVPSLTISETYSDNVALLSDELARRGWISDLIPGIRIDANGARLKGYLDYRLHQLYYSDERQLDSTQHILASSATLEAIEKILFIDGRAEISQQNRSPLEASVSVDRPSASNNRIETRTFQLSPYTRGRISDLAVYQLRYNASYVRSEGGELPTTRVGELIGRIRNASSFAKIGWAVDVNSLTARSDEIGTLDNSRVRGLLIYSIDPLLNVSAIYGRETTDFSGIAQRTTNTHGVGVNWQPSPRTQLAADVEKRFFGTGHTAMLSYRAARTALRFTSSRDAVVLPGLLPGSSSNSVYGLLTDLFATAIPDPAQRAEAARRRLDETGIPASFPLATGSLTSRPLIYDSQTATIALLGTRSTATLRFTRLDQRGARALLPDEIPVLGEDVRQTGVTGSWAYRLTPATTMTGSATALRTEDAGIGSLTTRQTLFSLSLSTQLGPRTTASLGVRHAEFDSPVPLSSYRENAISAALQFRL